MTEADAKRVAQAVADAAVAELPAFLESIGLGPGFMAPAQGRFAAGGVVRDRSAGMVGERGPEMILPRRIAKP